MAGYNYAVTCSTNYNAVKIGFTTKQDPDAYLSETYGRVMQPMNVISVVPVANARLCEGIIHFMLNPHRVAARREVFDMANDDGSFKQQLWDEVLRRVREMNEMSGLALPEGVDTIRRKKQEAADSEERRLLAIQQQLAIDRREKERLRLEKQQHEQLRQQNKKRKRDERLAKEEAAKLETERRRGEHARLLDDFIRRHCRVEPQLTAITKAFKESFEGTAKTSITTQALAAQMKARGYLREQQTTGLRSMTFKGIELL